MIFFVVVVFLEVFFFVVNFGVVAFFVAAFGVVVFSVFAFRSVKIIAPINNLKKYGTWPEVSFLYFYIKN